MISQALVDYTDMGRDIGCMLDKVYVPHISMRGIMDLQPHFSVHQWYHTQDPRIIYVYVNLYMTACYLHHRKNNRMENFH